MADGRRLLDWFALGQLGLIGFCLALEEARQVPSAWSFLMKKSPSQY
jgi:hypothetical protein